MQEWVTKEAEHFRMMTRSRAYVGVSSWSGGEHHKSEEIKPGFGWVIYMDVDGSEEKG